MMHNNGISYEGDLLDLGAEHKVVNRSGSWFKYGETYLGQGKEKARNFLIENTDVADEIKQKVMAAGGYAAPLEELPAAPAGEDVAAVGEEADAALTTASDHHRIVLAKWLAVVKRSEPFFAGRRLQVDAGRNDAIDRRSKFQS